MTPRQRLRAPIIVAGAVAAVALALLGDHLVATTIHAHAWPTWAAADARYDDASTDYAATAERSGSAVARAEYLLEMATGDLVAADDHAALAEHVERARELLADAPAPPAGIVELGAPDAPAPAWERYADLWRLVELVPSHHSAAVRFDAAAEQVAGGTKAIADASEALVSGTEERAEAALAESTLATYRARLAVEQAIDGIRHSPSMSSGDANRFTALATAVSEVRTSHAAEQEHRNAYPVRAEIEAFARSIASGLELEFAWAYEVAGRASDQWYSGTTEFKPEGVGWGLISLTESVEREWATDENAKALVVHEVGHAQVLGDDCYPIFEAAPFSSDHEMWATAWAIGMGYDLPGAGIEAYGRPSDAQIAAAAACR
ncbi:hypothetical protein [Agromyces ramosus]|uniref:hypothetical protein n=1 Tax=Agromyces ramosus TaxID=33879 RepID=UPI0027D8DC0B|nr:hypothetical protein [Agromyces ramosus]